MEIFYRGLKFEAGSTKKERNNENEELGNEADKSEINVLNNSHIQIQNQRDSKTQATIRCEPNKKMQKELDIVFNISSQTDPPNKIGRASCRERV